jgi:membrane-bound metal-dependent hydrolase YbcI (DUF457 family)
MDYNFRAFTHIRVLIAVSVPVLVHMELEPTAGVRGVTHSLFQLSTVALAGLPTRARSFLGVVLLSTSAVTVICVLSNAVNFGTRFRYCIAG